MSRRGHPFPQVHGSQGPRSASAGQGAPRSRAPSGGTSSMTLHRLHTTGSAPNLMSQQNGEGLTRSARRHEGSLSTIDKLLEQSRALRTELNAKRRALVASFDQDNQETEKALAACPPTQAAIDNAKQESIIRAGLVPGGKRRAKARAAARRGPTTAQLEALEREVKREARRRERQARRAREEELAETGGARGVAFRGYYVPELQRVRCTCGALKERVFVVLICRAIVQDALGLDISLSDEDDLEGAGGASSAGSDQAESVVTLEPWQQSPRGADHGFGRSRVGTAKSTARRRPWSRQTSTMPPSPVVMPQQSLEARVRTGCAVMFQRVCVAHVCLGRCNDVCEQFEEKHSKRQEVLDVLERARSEEAKLEEELAGEDDPDRQQTLRVSTPSHTA